MIGVREGWDFQSCPQDGHLCKASPIGNASEASEERGRERTACKERERHRSTATHTCILPIRVLLIFHL